MNCRSCLSLGPRLNCTIHGDGPVPLLFLHGFAAAAVTWDDLAVLLAGNRYTLYLLDLKGSGKSEKPRDGSYRPEDHASHVLDVIEGFSLRGVVLVGHSLGGGIALLAWHKARETGRSALIGSLVLIDAAAYPQRLPRFFGYLRHPLAGWLLLHLIPVRTLVRFNLNHVYHDPAQVTEARITRYSSSYRGRNTVYALITTARQLEPGRYAHQYPDHRSVTIPTLILWGRHDRVIPLAFGERLHEEIHGSRLIVLECGHNPHEEAPAASAAAIKGFLEQLPSR